MTRRYESGEGGVVGCVMGVDLLDCVNTRTLGWCWVCFFCLWRPGRAFFQIGLVCVMSHHQSPHRRALHIPVLLLAGKFKMEFLLTVRLLPKKPNFCSYFGGKIQNGVLAKS